MSKASSSDTHEITSVDDLSSDVAVKVVREVHCFRWYAETRWLARRDDGGVVFLEPDVGDSLEGWHARLYPESRAHELDVYLEDGEVDVRPRSHLPSYTEPVVEAPDI